MTREPTPPVRSNTVWGVALAAFTVVSLCLLAGDAWWRAPQSVLSTVAFRFLFGALPMGLPATLVGAWLATSLVAQNPRRRSLSGWMLQGAAFGALLGASGFVAWFVLINGGPSPAIGATVAPLSLFGATLGLLVGLIVGVWCWRISRPV